MPGARYKIGSIQFSNYTDEELLHEIENAVLQKKRITLTHPNTHFVVEASRNREFLNCISRCSYIQADGIGIFAATRFLYPRETIVKSVQTGTDFYFKLMKYANEMHYAIYFLGSSDEVLDSLIRRVRSEYQGIRIAGSHHGYFDLQESSVVEEINVSKPEVLLIGMGVPRQEYWLQEHCGNLSVPVCITVGAGLEFISGIKQRAPKVFRRFGLEWFFRFLQEPGRLWRRYLIGIPQFIIIVVKQKFGK